MNLIKVDVVHTEPLQTGVDRRHDRFARKATGIGPVAPREKDFRRDHQLIALAHLAQGAADDFFARAIGVDVGRVEKINSEFECARDKGPALLFVQTPGMIAPFRHAVGHAAEAEARHFQAGFSKSGVLHRII
jgi:hypothetical protein